MVRPSHTVVNGKVVVIFLLLLSLIVDVGSGVRGDNVPIGTGYSVVRCVIEVVVIFLLLLGLIVDMGSRI